MLGLIWKRISQFYFQEPISDWRAVNCRQFVQLWRKKLWPNCEKKKCWKTRSKLPSWEPKLVLKYPHGWQNTLYCPFGWLKLDKLPSWVAKTCANVSYWEPKRAPFFFLFSHPPFKKSLCAPLSQLLHFPAYSFKWNWTFTRFFFQIWGHGVEIYIYIFFSTSSSLALYAYCSGVGRDFHWVITGKKIWHHFQFRWGFFFSIFFHLCVSSSPCSDP